MWPGAGVTLGISRVLNVFLCFFYVFRFVSMFCCGFQPLATLTGALVNSDLAV